MRTIERSVLFAIFLGSAIPASPQDRKPGLYEVTLTTTTISPSANTYPPRTMQACLTREMIDKYGAIVPETPIRACQFVNIAKKSDGMTADFTCSGFIMGNGTLVVNWSDSEHTKGNLHFSGTIRPGDHEIKIEWNAATTSVYKGPDCGTLTPASPPQSPPPAALSPVPKSQ
jgi:hypothetical protein